MESTGGKYGDVYEGGPVTATDALYILHYTVGNLNEYYEGSS